MASLSTSSPRDSRIMRAGPIPAPGPESGGGSRPPVWVVSYPESQSYLRMWDLQRRLREHRIAGRIPDLLLLLEHDPVVTLGRNGRKENLLLSRRQFHERGVEVVETDRGGDVTCHAPGQLVGYWIFDLRSLCLDVRRFVREIEETLIRTLGGFGIEGGRREGATGVWVRTHPSTYAKIAAMGLHLSRWVSSHGFALNFSTDLEPFKWIVPCGIRDCRITTMEQLLGRPISRDELERMLLPEMESVFGLESHRLDPHELADIVGMLDRGVPSQGAGPSGASGPGESGPGKSGPDRSGSGVHAAGGGGDSSRRTRRPDWLRVRLPQREEFGHTRRIVKRHRLHTVCESAGCPNICECWSAGTATFMILGNVCTRGCGFCGVQGGCPGPADPDEPGRVASAVAEMGLAYAVLTSVTRDDLPDGGAALWAATIRAVRECSYGTCVEVLVPDFTGDPAALDQVIAAGPDVLGHNVETVPRLYPSARPQADYRRSLELLRRAGECGAVTKSSLMLGLGEEEAEVFSVMDDLRAAGCELLALGQYLQPTRDNLSVDRFVPPEEFNRLADAGRARGFLHVESGPLVRSSYHADAAARSADRHRGRVGKASRAGEIAAERFFG